MAFIEIVSHFLNALKSKYTGVQYCKPLRMNVGEEGGTEKSRIIDATRALARAYGKQNAVQTFAAIGIAAKNVNGKTVRLSFKLAKNDKRDKSTNRDKAFFLELIITLWYEISMTSKVQFARALRNLR